MDASPMSSGLDGSLVLGSKDTSLLLLDAATGQLLEEVSAFGGRIVQIADLIGATPATPPRILSGTHKQHNISGNNFRGKPIRP